MCAGRCTCELSGATAVGPAAVGLGVLGQASLAVAVGGERGGGGGAGPLQAATAPTAERRWWRRQGRRQGGGWQRPRLRQPRRAAPHPAAGPFARLYGRHLRCQQCFRAPPGLRACTACPIYCGCGGGVFFRGEARSLAIPQRCAGRCRRPLYRPLTPVCCCPPRSTRRCPPSSCPWLRWRWGSGRATPHRCTRPAKAAEAEPPPSKAHRPPLQRLPPPSGSPSHPRPPAPPRTPTMARRRRRRQR
jgi:hypothetical protein